MSATTLQQIVVVVLSGVCLVSFGMLFVYIQRGASPTFETHWGGLGGGLGGWRISPAMTYLVTGTFAAVLLAAVVPGERGAGDLRRKYASVERIARRNNVVVSNFHVEKDRLILRGVAPSDVERNRVWDQIKLIDPDYPDITAEIQVPAVATPNAAAAKPSGPVDSTQREASAQNAKR